MSNVTLLQAIRDRVLLGDGAMGTQLQQAGLESGGCGEAWNLDHPDRVLAIQRAYAEAGSDCIITNTFGASRIMLERHGQADRTAAINEAGARITRQAFGGRDGFVLGDIGPFGGLMEPYGEIAVSRVEQTLRQQARALVAGGVDAIIIETQTALEELEIAIAAAREAGAPVVIGSLAYDKMADEDEVRTMMGVSPEMAAEFMAEREVDILALNCGTGVDVAMATDVVRRYRRVSGRPIMAQPNAGQPVLENFKVVYHETPEQMARDLPGLVRAGASIVGGCCGSTPAHIRRFRQVLDGGAR
ncbi:MAG: homocysteine methyltransferase [Acidobacteria bacterium]|nr:MAG: homocysteine methyltransferase [Acidobacteriota bacterium]